MSLGTADAAYSESELAALSRDDVRKLEVAAMFAELSPERALEDACLEHHRYNVAQQRERNLFARNGREASRPGRSETRYVTIDGTTHSVSEWAKLRGISYSTVKERLARGMTPEQALKAKVRPYVRRDLETRMVTIEGETRTFAAWARHRKIHPTTARQRIERGMSMLEALTTPVDERYSPVRHRRQSRPEEALGTLVIVRDPADEPMPTREAEPREERSVQKPTPAEDEGLVNGFGSALRLAQQRARVKAELQAALEPLSLEDRRAVIADLLIAMEPRP